MITKICNECNKQFTPSSRHLKCPSCRKHGYNSCECGNSKQRSAKKCNTCHIKLNKKPLDWTGNKIIHKKGYVLVRIPEHPNAVNGYVFEHRLVMEKIIGRLLLPNENVHHKNGIKDDNRAENLELWLKTQPAGQRISDLLDWALEIIKLYGGEKYYSNKL